MSESELVVAPTMVSERLRLATAVLHAARAVAGVRGLSAGPNGLLATSDRSTRVEGVRCVAADLSGYEVDIGLVCDPVNLVRLADAVRQAIERAGARLGLPVNRVSVQILDLADGVGA